MRAAQRREVGVPPACGGESGGWPGAVRCAGWRPNADDGSPELDGATVAPGHCPRAGTPSR